MHFAIAALLALCLNMHSFAQDKQEESRFYKVSIVELALPADAELPFSLDAEESPEKSWVTIGSRESRHFNSVYWMAGGPLQSFKRP